MHRTRSEAGAAAVEFAILAPLIFMLIFGMLFGGLAWNAKQGLSHAAREAARYAATLPLDGASCDTQACWLQDVATQAVNSAEGQLGTTPGESYDAYGQTFDTYVCVAYVKTGETFNQAWGSADGLSAPAAGEPCLDDGIGVNDQGRVQVHIAREQLFQAVLVGRTLVLQSATSARHEFLE